MSHYAKGKCGMLLAWMGLLLSVMVTLRNKFLLGNVGLLLSVLCMVVSHVFFYRDREKIRGEICLNCAILSLFGVLFWDTALLAPATDKSNLLNIVVIGVLLHAALVFWSIFAWNKKVQWKGKLCLREFWPVWVILGLFWILSLEVLDDWFRWDSRCYVVYMKVAEAFDFTLASVKDLNLVGHLALGFSVPALFLGNLFGNMELGCRVMNLLEASLAIACFYGILNHLLPREKRQIKILGTATFALSPWVMGMVGDVSLDYASLCFLSAFVYVSLKHNWVLQIVFGFLLCFSKEPGVILCTAYAGGCFLVNFYKKNETSLVKRFWVSLFDKTCILHAIPVVTWVGMYLVNTRWGAGDSFHYFGWTPSFAVPKAKAMLLLNFNWLLWLTIFVCVLWILFQSKKKNAMSEQGQETSLILQLIPMICSFAGFVMFSLLFVTYNHTRYLQPQFFFLALFAVLAISSMDKTSWEIQENTVPAAKASGVVKSLLLSGVTVLLCVQSFSTIDVVTEKLSGFATVDIGGDTLISTNWIAPPDNVGDPIMSNRQGSYFDETLRRVFQYIDPSEDTLVVFPSPYQGVASYGYQQEYIFFNLLGEFKYSYLDMFWDEEKTLLSLNETDGSRLVRFALMNAELPGKLQPADEIYYLSFPWITEDPVVLAQYEVLGEEMISYRGWEITVKRLAYMGEPAGGEEA